MIQMVLQKSQQYMLSREGFYKGKIDGIWGEQSQSAMQEFATDPGGKFAPATLKEDCSPFAPFEALPQDYLWSEIDGQRCVSPAPKGDTASALGEKQRMLDALQEVSDTEQPVASTEAKVEPTPQTVDAADTNHEESSQDDNQSRETLHMSGNSGRGRRGRRNRNKQHHNPNEQPTEQETTSDEEPKEKPDDGSNET